MAVATAKKSTNGKPDPKHNIEAVRQAYYERIAKHDMAPLWKVMKSVVTKEPVTRCVPVVWHYDDVKSLVMESGGLITAEEANRRVLVLENPAMHGESKATNTLFAGIQMILPGEIAPAHRHVSSAIRFVLDGEGAYTAVEGEKAFMSPGDFVITAQLGAARPRQSVEEADAVARRARFPGRQLLRGLVRRGFRRRRRRRPRAQDGDSLTFYGSGVLPDGTPAQPNRTPVINYTYARTRPIVERMMQAGDIDKRHGARVRYANPVTGGPVLPTMGAWLAMLPKGFKGEPYRSTDGTIFVCTEGQGTTTVDGKVLEWGPNDVFVVPPWKRYHAQCGEGVGAVLDLRPPGAGSARHLARGEVGAASSFRDARSASPECFGHRRVRSGSELTPLLGGYDSGPARFCPRPGMTP